MIAAAIAIVPIDFNIAFSIGFLIGVPFTLWRFQRGEILGSVPTSWRTILGTLATIAAIALWAPAHVSGGLGAGFIAGAFWIGLVIHEAL